MADLLAPFDQVFRPRIVFGPGAAARVGELAAGLGGKKVLVVTDPGVVGAGHARRVAESLQKVEIGVRVYDKVRENPTTGDVERCVEFARGGAVDCIVGLGGGSAMDTAKGANFILTNGGKMADYRGAGKAGKAMLPLIAVPTTAGTGSECQSFALIAEEGTHQKMACGDAKAMPRVALLDPELTLTQPEGVTAASGIDAVAHCVETAVTRARNGVSLMYCHHAFGLTSRNLAAVMGRPEDLGARAGMQLGAALAGCAIEASMLGAAHAAANPLTAHFGVVHGQAVGVMLGAVVRFNAGDDAAREGYHALMRPSEAGTAVAGDSVKKLLAVIEGLMNACRVPQKLSEHGVRAGDLAMLAKEAAGQWTAAFNPRAVGAADFEGMYREVL